MSKVKTNVGRRSFIKSVGLAGGGMMIGFSWLYSCKETPEGKAIAALEMPENWY